MTPAEVQLICIAKAPVAGKVKTRLTPHFTPQQAAELAAAALTDTLDAIAATPAMTRTLALEGDPTEWSNLGSTVIPQRGDGLAQRLANAIDDVWSRRQSPLLLVGMDTPQVTPELLADATKLLTNDGIDAILGLADDGGWWAIGLRRADPKLLEGIPMSTATTGRLQLERLHRDGLHVGLLPKLTDVDTPETVATVAALAPSTRFGRLAATLLAGSNATDR